MPRRRGAMALSDEEYEVVKRHSEWGEELLAQLGFPGDVRRLVRDHHERVLGREQPELAVAV